MQMIYKHYMREIEEADAADKPLHEQFSYACTASELCEKNASRIP